MFSERTCCIFLDEIYGTTALYIDFLIEHHTYLHEPANIHQFKYYQGPGYRPGG